MRCRVQGPGVGNERGNRSQFKFNNYKTLQGSKVTPPRRRRLGAPKMHSRPVLHMLRATRCGWREGGGGPTHVQPRKHIVTVIVIIVACQLERRSKQGQSSAQPPTAAATHRLYAPSWKIVLPGHQLQRWRKPWWQGCTRPAEGQGASFRFVESNGQDFMCEVDTTDVGAGSPRVV
jgi:hypothetical protein